LGYGAALDTRGGVGLLVSEHGGNGPSQPQSSPYVRDQTRIKNKRQSLKKEKRAGKARHVAYICGPTRHGACRPSSFLDGSWGGRARLAIGQHAPGVPSHRVTGAARRFFASFGGWGGDCGSPLAVRWAAGRERLERGLAVHRHCIRLGHQGAWPSGFSRARSGCGAKIVQIWKRRNTRDQLGSAETKRCGRGSVIRSSRRSLWSPSRFSNLTLRVPALPALIPCGFTPLCFPYCNLQQVVCAIPEMRAPDDADCRLLLHSPCHPAVSPSEVRRALNVAVVFPSSSVDSSHSSN
jgi:hypothetical protein